MAKWWDRWKAAHDRAQAEAANKKAAKRERVMLVARGKLVEQPKQPKPKSRFWSAFDQIDRFS